MTDVWLAGGIFVAAYIAIASERVDRTVVALLGGTLVVGLGIIEQHVAFAAIDLNVIFLLAGMMVIAGVLGRTGFFEWLGLQAVRRTDAEPMRLLAVLVVVTAGLSAVLDNVTTVVLLAPVTLTIAGQLGVTPYPFLLSQIMASNIGGTATLIGDPPNIVIGSAAGLDFADFVVNLGPVVVVILLVYLVISRLVFRGSLSVTPQRRRDLLAAKADSVIRDVPLLTIALGVLGAVLIAFVFHTELGLEAATIAMLGAAALLLLGGLGADEAFGDIEWPTLLFFVGLFVLVEGIVHVGIIDTVADELARLTEGQDKLAVIGLVWVSAGASAVIDNIPYTAAAVPVVERLIETGMPADPLWWALALGACLGGNLTIVGASANVVVANKAARAGHPIRFGQFLRHGALVVVISLAISSAYLWLRYLA